MTKVVLVLALAASALADDCSSVKDADKMDCGFVGIDSDGCQSKVSPLPLFISTIIPCGIPL